MFEVCIQMCITDVLTDVEKALFHLVVGSVQDKEFVTVLTLAGFFLFVYE